VRCRNHLNTSIDARAIRSTPNIDRARNSIDRDIDRARFDRSIERLQRWPTRPRDRATASEDERRPRVVAHESHGRRTARIAVAYIFARVSRARATRDDGRREREASESSDARERRARSAWDSIFRARANGEACERVRGVTIAREREA